MSSALDDIVIVLEYLASTKTLSGAAADAMARLKKRPSYPVALKYLDVRTEVIADEARTGFVSDDGRTHDDES